MFTTLTTLWKFFYHSPKRCENLKEVQKVLDLPELKITKPSDTGWLAHERCVSAVKRCYGVIVTTLEQIYEGSHEPEALGLNRILRRSSTLFTIYLLDFLPPQVSKLSKCLQSQSLIISSLVDATLHALDDVIQPAANWILELQEVMDEMASTIGIKFTTEEISDFQSRVAKLFFHVTERKYSKPVQFSRCCIKFQYFQSKENAKASKRLQCLW